MPRGGKRIGAGRPKGSTKGVRTIYYRRIKPEMAVVLDRILERFKDAPNEWTNNLLFELNITDQSCHFNESII